MGEVIGSWLYSFMKYEREYKIIKREESFFMVKTNRSGLTEEVEVIRTNQWIEKYAEVDSKEYYILNHDGTLDIYDEDGFVSRMEKLGIISE